MLKSYISLYIELSVVYDEQLKNDLILPDSNKQGCKRPYTDFVIIDLGMFDNQNITILR